MTDTHYIQGQWQNGNGAEFHSCNPATGSHVWSGQAACQKTVEQAVLAAEQALPHWRSLTWQQRLTYLEKYVSIVDEHAADLAYCIGEENGKPLWEAKQEVSLARKKLEISVEAFQQRTGDKQSQATNILQSVRHQPLGVMAVLGPFNFPAHLPHGHILPALLAGNTIVFKPSEYTPKTGMLLAQYWDQAQLPAGVFNLIQGQQETGQALCALQVNGILFTGSYQTGRKIHAACAGQPEKLLALEMGGNNPLIIFDVDDIEAAALHTVLSSFISAGQRCTCARRLIIQKNDPRTQLFLQRLIAITENLQIGKFDTEPQPFMGPVISSRTAEKLVAYVDAQKKLGAESLLDLSMLEPNTGFLSPGILDVTHQRNRSDEEYFGPLLQVIQVNDLDAAIREANQTSYGLAAGIITDHESHFIKFYQQTKAGIINWNRQLTGAASDAPFGGVGFSGNYRPSAFYAADYCAYPVASMTSEKLVKPDLPPGVHR